MFHHFLVYNLTAVYRSQRTLENRLSMEDDKIALLEQQVKSLKVAVGDAERKYEEVSAQLLIFFARSPDDVDVKT